MPSSHSDLQMLWMPISIRHSRTPMPSTLRVSSRAMGLALSLLCGAGLAWPPGASATNNTIAFNLRSNDPTEPAPALDNNYQILGALDLAPLAAANSAVAELSGLAYDADDNVLYAVTDRGQLLHLRPLFERGHLTDVLLLEHHSLTNAAGTRLTGKSADSEGLSGRRLDNGISGDAELVISFERQPRILAFDRRGRWLRRERLAKALKNPNRYADSNKGLEAVTVHPTAGVLSAPEFPLKHESDDRVRIYSPDGLWLTLPRLKTRNAAIVALEALPDGSILSMERAHDWWTLSLTVALRLTQAPNIAGNREPAPGRTIVRMNSANGWAVENFEGLARHKSNRFFMVSDDNGQPFLNTVLVYFAIPSLDL
jgi:hypothetical protein